MSEEILLNAVISIVAWVTKLLSFGLQYTRNRKHKYSQHDSHSRIAWSLPVL